MAPRSKISRLPQPVKGWLDKALADNGFADYELLAAELKERGFDISKSAVHRYGQEFEDKLLAIKIATEQARAITEAMPDNEGSMNNALISLVQQKAFQTLVTMEEGASLKEIGLMVARLSNATVKQKQWRVEMEEKIREQERAKAADSAVQIARKGGLTADVVDSIRREILGIAA
jgi:intein-encoded DNA endonuclease-like protein